LHINTYGFILQGYYALFRGFEKVRADQYTRQINYVAELSTLIRLLEEGVIIMADNFDEPLTEIT